MTRDASIALLGSFDAGAELARGVQSRHSQSDYLRAVWALSEALPHGRHVLNFCRNRYHFLVGLGACLLAQKISLLPSTRTLAVLQQIEQQYPDTFCLHDGQGLGELCSDANDCDKPTIRLFAYPADLEQGSETTPRMPAMPSAPGAHKPDAPACAAGCTDRLSADR